MDWLGKLSSATELNQTLSATERFVKACERLAQAPDGSRNAELTKVAFIGGTLIQAEQVQQHWVEKQLLEACEQNDYVKDASEEEVLRVARIQIEAGKAAEPTRPKDSAPAEGSENPLFKAVVPVGKIGSLPKASELIKGVIYEDSLVFLIADPNVGKSFMALDLAAHLASESHWHGRPILKNVNTVYITPEGTGNLYKRVAAWEKMNGKTMTGIDFFPFGIKVGSQGWEYLKDYCNQTQPGLIIIDTWSRNNGGRDENGQADTSLAIEQLDQLRHAAEGATILVLHHLNKMGEIRGSSTLEGAADTVIKLADPGHGVLNCWFHKQKDGDKNDKIGQFRLEEVVLDPDNDVTSVVFTPVNPIPWEGRNND
jgi:hypothetical protein